MFGAVDDGVDSNGCFFCVVGYNHSCDNKWSSLLFLLQQTTITTKCWSTNHQQNNKRETVNCSFELLVLWVLMLSVAIGFKDSLVLSAADCYWC